MAWKKIPKGSGVKEGVGESGGEATAVPHLGTEGGGPGKLDKSVGLELKKSMPSHRRSGESKHLAVLKQELAALQRRSVKLWGEIGAQEQEYVERQMMGAASAAALRRYQQLLERFAALEQRRVEVRGAIAARMAAGDDLPSALMRIGRPRSCRVPAWRARAR